MSNEAEKVSMHPSLQDTLVFFTATKCNYVTVEMASGIVSCDNGSWGSRSPRLIEASGKKQQKRLERYQHIWSCRRCTKLSCLSDPW